MKTKSFIEGGHFQKKGYYYKLYFILPEFSKNYCTSITGSEQKSIKIKFPSSFLLTSNDLYCNIGISVLGFGMGLEIQSRS